MSDSVQQSEKKYWRRIYSWAMYDWANHSYITTTATTFFPLYFIAIAAPAFLQKGATGDEAMSLAKVAASNKFAFVVSLALLVSAFLAPVIGSFADLTGWRKKILIFITIIGGSLASLMYIITTGMWITALILYFLTQMIVYLALGLNSSLLPHIAAPKDINKASSLGYAFGYIGGGILLAINTALFSFSSSLGISGELAVRIAFLSVGIWWIGFSFPLLLSVPEAPPLLKKEKEGNAFLGSFTQLYRTIINIKKYKELFKMLVAFWFYMEGVGAIILLATAYGTVLGLDSGVLIGTLLMTQVVAFPYSLIFGQVPNKTNEYRTVYLSMLIWTGITLPIIGIYANINGSLSVPVTFLYIGLDQIFGILFSLFIGKHLFSGLEKHIDSKRSIILGLLIYTIIPVWGFFLHTQAEYFMIGWLVGTVQGGTQALSRGIYARLTPPSKSGEFFGLYGLSEKFAGILGPLLYGIIGEITHNPRASLFSIVIFFIIGIYMLLKVDVETGEKIAIEEELQLK